LGQGINAEGKSNFVHDGPSLGLSGCRLLSNVGDLDRFLWIYLTSCPK